MKQVLGFQYCIPFAARQIVNLMVNNCVYVPPGTSKHSKSLEQKCSGLLSYIDFQGLDYLVNFKIQMAHPKFLGGNYL